MKLKLFPHQQAAVEWMLRREREPKGLHHPLYMGLMTEDGFGFYINAVFGKIGTGTVPSIMDFRGGMFCDEPGLGKTFTALSHSEDKEHWQLPQIVYKFSGVIIILSREVLTMSLGLET